LLLAHASVCFYRAWQKNWGAVNLLVTAGFIPTFCLAGVTITALVEIFEELAN
jgi:hypothetical protein